MAEKLVQRCRQRCVARVVLCALGLALGVARGPGATTAAGSLLPGEVDFEQPKLLTGAIYAGSSEPSNLLFTFRRTADRTGSTVRVLREYQATNGAAAARERVTYEQGRLVSFEWESLQTGARGKATLQSEPQHSLKQKISFQYGRGPGSKTESKAEGPRKDVLINDMLPSFLVNHWEDLMKGESVKFRFIVLPRLETVGFKLVKDSESTWRGRPVVLIRMEPTSVIIARLVEPVHFTVEKGGSRRILQYVGRTTPMIRRGEKWEDLDAVTVFDWPQ